jgi:cell division protease FtsH
MKETFVARWVRRIKSAGRRTKQFFSLHPLQSGLLLFMIVLVAAQVWLVVDQTRANSVERSRIQALPTIQLNELNQRIKDNQVQKIVRHTLSTGNALKPQTKNYLEVVSAKDTVVLEESSASSAEVWKGLVDRAFSYPFVLETGFQADREDRLAGILRMAAIMVFVILVVLMAQLMVGEVLSGKDFKVHRPDRDIVLDDVIGNPEVKASLREVIDQLYHAEAYAQQKIVAPKGILFTGDPGVGKTMLAKALANEIQADFFFATGADFAEMYVGVGPKRVRSLFKRARMSRLAVIFIDEIDAIGSRDEMGNDSERRSTINAMLSELDGMEANGRLLVVGATNHLERLDPALRRRGRFDRIVHIPLPDVAAREQILSKYLVGTPLDGGVDLKAMAQRTQGYSGAQLAGVAAEAKNLALREMGGRGQTFTVRQDHLQQAQEIALLGEAGRTAEGEELHRVTVHELGHALTGHLCCPKAFVEKVTVRGRGGALGYTLSRPLEESLLVSEPEFRSQLVMALGGRAAEEVLLGSVSNGASDDLRRASQMARSMVVELGMGKRSGLMARVRSDEAMTDEQKQDVREILEESYAKAKALVEEHREWFMAKTQDLIEHGMLPHEALFSDLSARKAAVFDTHPAQCLDCRSVVLPSH